MGARFRRTVNPKIGAALLTAVFGRYEGEDSDSASKVSHNPILPVVIRGKQMTAKGLNVSSITYNSHRLQ